jgi:uncharacterized cupin superfamily protein
LLLHLSRHTHARVVVVVVVVVVVRDMSRTLASARVGVFDRRATSRAHRRVRTRAARDDAPQKVVVNDTPSEDQLARARAWPTWGCDASEFPWSYGAAETCLVIEGEARVVPDDERLAPVELKPGVMATFPAGMSCTWIVTKAIRKHYSFH